MIDEIDFFVRRNDFQKKKKVGDYWNELKKLKQKEKKSDKENAKKKDKSSPPPADTDTP